jgi:hypothetical protein
VEGGLPLLPVVACWLTGYLAFHAATVWLKSPPARRAVPRTALAVYLAVSAVFGGLSLVLLGPGLLGWAAPFAPLVAGALLLAAGRRERSLASGGLTVAAASLMTLVVRFGTPDALLGALGSAPGAIALWHTGLVFAYLFGTVLYVKTMIRERGSALWWAVSVGWHGAAALVTGTAAASGALGAAWPGFFLATVLRAWLVPLAATRRPVRPVVVGLVEIVFTVGFLVVAALA